MMKVCTKCGVEKPVEAFSKDCSRKDGLQCWCKLCVAAYCLKHKEERATYKKDYDLDHKEESAAYRLENKEQLAAHKKAYDLENKEQLAAHKKAYDLNHKEEAAAYNKDYAPKHKEERNARRRKRRQTDPNFIFAEFCRDQVKRMLKDNPKDYHSDEYLGCTKDEGRAHIESLWEPGMTWKNRGEWHIHHIENIAGFDPEDPTSVFWACNISNLQPLWVEDHKRVHSNG